MGRRAVEVNIEQLKSVINEVEKVGGLTNRNQLFKLVGSRLGISPSVVMLRVQEHNIPLFTPKGKKGRQKGCKIGPVNRTSRADKLKSNVNRSALAVLRASTPKNYHTLVDKIEKGSIKAMIKLKCLECVGFERRVEGSNGETIDMIGDCQICACPIYTIRPFQKG